MSYAIWTIFIVLLAAFFISILDTVYIRDFVNFIRKKLKTPKRTTPRIPSSNPTLLYEKDDTSPKINKAPNRYSPDDFDNKSNPFAPSTYTEILSEPKGSSSLTTKDYERNEESSLIESMRMTQKDESKQQQTSIDPLTVFNSSNSYWSENAPGSKNRILKTAKNPIVEPITIEKKDSKHVYTSVFTGKKKESVPASQTTNLNFKLPQFANITSTTNETTDKTKPTNLSSSPFNFSFDKK